MHSILIDTVVTDFVGRRLSKLVRFYRLLYNGLSLMTLVPLVVFTWKAGGEVMFSWQSWAIPGRVLLLVAALLFFRAGATKYDLLYFFGFRQLHTGEAHLLLNDSPNFSVTGVFGMTRHPWYLGSLLFIWSVLPEYRLPVFLVAVILTIYLVVGTLLEERKIIARYGDAYRLYQQQVSMLFPWKWLKKNLR